MCCQTLKADITWSPFLKLKLKLMLWYDILNRNWHMVNELSCLQHGIGGEHILWEWVIKYLINICEIFGSMKIFLHVERNCSTLGWGDYLAML